MTINEYSIYYIYMKYLQPLTSILLIIIISVAIYANTLKNGFVYDDEFTIVNNTLIKSFSNMPKLFQKDYFPSAGEGTYRPVATFTYFVDYAIYGLNPWGFHLTNVLLHAINGVLLCIFLNFIIQPATGNTQRSLFVCLFASPLLLASLLFITHPVLTEAVNAVSFREDLLAFLFYMAALNLYFFILKDRPPRYLLNYLLYSVSCFLYFMALLSKEMALTFPIIICCYEWIYKRKKGGLLSILLNPLFIGYLVVTIVYVYLSFGCFYNPLKKDNPFVWSGIEKIISLPWLLLNYIKLSMFPTSLSADYEITPLKYLVSPLFIISTIVIISSIIIAFAIRERKRETTFGILFFFITLVPVYNIIPLSNPLAERYLYLPIAGFIIVSGSVINNISLSFHKKYGIGRPNILLTIIIFLIVSIYSLAVINRNEVWKDNYSLFLDTIRKMPDSERIHFNLGKTYMRQSMIEKAIEEFKTAIKLYPDYADAHYNLGYLYGEIGMIGDAISEYQMVLKLNPGHVEAHYNLGFLYLSKGMRDQAKTEFEIILKLKPDSLMTNKALSIIK